MSPRVVIEEFHMTLFIPIGMSGKEVQSSRKLLGSRRFRRRLRRDVRRRIARHPELVRVSVRVTR